MKQWEIDFARRECYNIKLKICSFGAGNMEKPMKSCKILSALFALLGTLAAVAGIYLSLSYKESGPMLVKRSQTAENQVHGLMYAVKENNFDQVGTMLYGQPEIGADRLPQEDVGVLLWEAFLESLRYELEGDFYATESGVARSVTVTTLDVASVTDVLRDRAQTLLQDRVAHTADADDVYDQNNEYREEFVMAVLYDACKAALETDAKTVTHQITINLIYENGQWWIMPEEALLEAITGGFI